MREEGKRGGGIDTVSGSFCTYLGVRGQVAFRPFVLCVFLNPSLTVQCIPQSLDSQWHRFLRATAPPPESVSVSRLISSTLRSSIP